MNLNHRIIKQLIRIRVVEQAFLDLFSQGLMNGTVHTCIGQELSAMAFAGQLKNSDFIFSNHRCHGHYMAYTKDWKGLILELMGEKRRSVFRYRGVVSIFKIGIFFPMGYKAVLSLWLLDSLLVIN